MPVTCCISVTHANVKPLTNYERQVFSFKVELFFIAIGLNPVWREGPCESYTVLTDVLLRIVVVEKIAGFHF